MRVSVGEVLQVYRTPDDDLPVAPAGVQKVPGETVGNCVAVGFGVAEALEVGVGAIDSVGAGVTLRSNPDRTSTSIFVISQEAIYRSSVTASALSTLKGYRVLIAIQVEI